MTFRQIRLAAVAAAVTLLYVFDPATSGIYPSCPLRAWTGWLCPGCGALRAMHALLHGSVGAAFQDNALATGAVLCAGVAWLHDRLRPVATPWLGAIGRAGVSAAGVVMALAFGALRNIPAAPFSWFTP